MTSGARAQDLLAIEEVLRRYAIGLDERRWSEWDRVFTADAVIDFRPMGGRLETPAQMRQRLSRPDPAWLFAQHPLTNLVTTIREDRASTFSHFQMETGRRGPEVGTVERVSGGGSYDDALVRTPAGWRIRERRVRLKWKETRVVPDEVRRG